MPTKREKQVTNTEYALSTEKGEEANNDGELIIEQRMMNHKARGSCIATLAKRIQLQASPGNRSQAPYRVKETHCAANRSPCCKVCTGCVSVKRTPAVEARYLYPESELDHKSWYLISLIG